jgi:hypothetical protein
MTALLRGHSALVCQLQLFQKPLPFKCRCRRAPAPAPASSPQVDPTDAPSPSAYAHSPPCTTLWCTTPDKHGDGEPDGGSLPLDTSIESGVEDKCPPIPTPALHSSFFFLLPNATLPQRRKSTLQFLPSSRPPTRSASPQSTPPWRLPPPPTWTWIPPTSRRG